MKKTLAILLIISISSLAPYQGMQLRALPPPQDDAELYFSAEQLENLVAPVALYPDPLLAQVLLASTFPDQIDAAAREVRAYGSGYNVDSAPWDVSVKAVAHYPTVLSMMADKLDWTITLGQAYVYQSTDVMEAVQRLRRRARSAGYLVTTTQQEIVDVVGFIYIYPANPRYIYVPVYDPAVVFVVHPVPRAGAVIWFSIGFLIGAWLNHDCDWAHYRVFYHGWAHGPVWVVRSRPHVRITRVYVNKVYANVVINRKVVDRRVNYAALNRYNSVHRDVDYSRVRRETGARPAPPPPRQPRPDNKIIRRNMDPNDPRIDANRGRVQLPPPQAREPQARRPETTRPTQEATRPAQVPRSPTVPPTPQATRPAQVPRAAPGQQQQRQPQSVFRGSSGAIDPHSASRRGQASRQQQSRPAPAAKQAPRQKSQQGQPRERKH